MKWLGAIKDPKDLTTKEYVDKSDKDILQSIEDSNKDIESLEKEKVSASDMSAYTPSEIQVLWRSAFSNN